MDYILLKNVEDLKRNSFLDPDLYREIISIESDLKREEFISKIREIAKQYGMAGTYDHMLAAATKEMQRVEKEDEKKRRNRQHMTDFSSRDEAGQFRCGNWVANDDGIYLEDDKGTHMASPHAIYPTRILKNTSSSKYKVELEYEVRGIMRKIIVARELVASPTKILALADDAVQVTHKTAPYLVEYLSDIERLNDDLICEVMSSSRLGWVEMGGKQVFIPYYDEVVFDSEQSLRPLFESVQTKGDREEWYSLVRQIREKKQNEVLINLAASFASVLVEPCGGLPFIVSMWGGTGIGKSVILKLCTSVWADPSEGQYITDAKATNTALEIRLNTLNSLPMTLDDMAQVRNQYGDDFSELIYRWCAGRGRDRSNKTLGLNKLTSWRNCTLTNGERSLVDESTQGGAVNRVIDIEASGSVLFDAIDGNRTVNTIENNYGFAGLEFIDLINDIGIESIIEIKERFYKQIKAVAASLGLEKEEKQIVPMALILTADCLTRKHLFRDDIGLDVAVCVKYLKNKGEVDENLRIYRYLIEQVVIHQRKFDDSTDENPPYEKWGYFINDNYVAIYSAQFDDILRKGNFQAKSFLSWAKKKNLLELDAKTKTPRKVVSHGPVRGARAVVIRTDYMNEQNDKSLKLESEELPFDDR